MNYSQFLNNPKEGIFFFFGLFIYFIFRLIQYLVNRYAGNRATQFLTKSFYFIEIIFWLVFLFEGVELFKNKNKVFSLFFALILVFSLSWSCWFILRDYIAGLYLNISASLKLNETIEFDGYVGKINKMGSRMLELQLTLAKSVNIPYHQFFLKRIIKTGSSVNCAREYFEFKLNPKIDAIESKSLIHTYIHQLPWVSDKFEQEILIEKVEGNSTVVKINVSLFDKKYFDRFQQKIKEKFE